MKTTKIINITGNEVLEHFVFVAENCTIQEAREKIGRALIFWDVRETGDVDRGTYNRTLKEIRITLEN